MAVNVNGGALEFSAVVNAAQFNAAISSIEKQLLSLTKVAEKEVNTIDELVRKTTTAIAAYASLATAKNFIGDIVRVRGEFQQLEVAFRTMLGSKEKADRLLEQAVELAATTPFSLQDVGTGAKQLLAYGFSAEEVIDTLRRLGDISAGIGAPLNDIAYLFGTLKSQGRAFAIDIRQFAQRGIPIYGELAKVLNVSKEEVNSLVEAGKVGFPEVEKVIKNLTSEGGMFFDLMKEQSKTLTGQISNLKDAWANMLNEIGKGQEGLFADAISAAKYLVENYKTVLDILKVLIITYGSYRAALIATNAVQAISTSLTKGYTIAETLRYQAMLISERAAKLLNATLLKNPAAFIAAGVAALVSSLILFARRSSESVSKAELLAQAQQKVGDSMAETRAKIEPYVNALKDANISETERLNIYNKLKEIDPKIVEGLDAKTISYDKLTKNVNLYLDSLRNQIKMEANKEALILSIKKEQELQGRLDKLLEQRSVSAAKQAKLAEDAEKSTNAVMRNRAKGLAGGAKWIATTETPEMKRLREDIEAQKKITEELGAETQKSEEQKQEAKLRTLEVIDGEIKALTDQQKKFSTNAREYQEFQKKINALEEEKKRIVGASKSDIAASNKLENEANSLLEKRKDLLEKISDLQDQSRQSGQMKELTELDKINEKYDDVIDNISEYNKKVDEFKKKNPKSQVQKVGQVDIQALNDARAYELSNQALKDDAAKFKESLEKKQKIFEQYEEAKKEVGLAKAKELYAEQTSGYETFLKMLEEEGRRLLPKVQYGIANIGELEKFKAITDQIKKYNEDQAEKNLETERKNFVELLQASATYNQQKAAINKKYDDLEATLKKNSNLKEVEERKKILAQGRQDELDILNSQMARSTELYRKLNQDIILFTRKRLQEEIKLLQKKLKTDTSLTPQMKADIQNTINQYKDLLAQTSKVGQDFGKIAGHLSAASGIFSTMADGVRELNSDLADALDNMSDMASVAADAAGAVASFSSGDLLGAINSTVSAISKIMAGFGKARESKRKAQQDIVDFQNKIIAGEIEYNNVLRERERQQVKLNKLTIQGLQDQKRLLEEQKSAVLKQYNEIFAQLQKESFVSGMGTNRRRGSIFGGLLGFFSGTRTETTQQLSSLLGKSYEEIEKLFSTGQLTDRAKELFEQLRKIKEEGVDIDALLAENAQAFREAITGTTADSITDSIVQGFAEGKRSAADFADTFQDLMQKALLQSLQLKYLEGPLKDFFEEFAALAESDGQLTNSEITKLQSLFNGIIDNASTQFQQLQQIAGLNFASQSGSSNSLTGAIKGMTEQQAELLAGQFGGLRMTALDALNISRQQLAVQNNIQANTAATVARMADLISKFNSYETGQKKLYVQV